MTCPQCGQGELVEKRTRFGLMYGCERYPDCDCAVNNPPEKDIPCPECGGLLLRRPKSLRCWHCGAEVDLDMKVTKPGDREAEAAARAAKAEARKARAAARAPEEGGGLEEGPGREDGRQEEEVDQEEGARDEEDRGHEDDRGEAEGRRGSGDGAGAGHGRRGKLGVASVADEVAALRGTRSATLGDLMTHPPFARLLAAMSVSSLGDWVGFLAVTALVAVLGGGTGGAAFSVAGSMLARTLPAVLFGPIAGALVDRLDRKRIMVIADLARGAMYVSMVFIRQLWAIYALSFVIESFSLVWGPARDASLPNLVPRRQLANANSIALASTYGTLPLGGSSSRCSSA